MLTRLLLACRRAGAVRWRRLAARAAGVVALVGVDDVADQPVPDDVGGGAAGRSATSSMPSRMSSTTRSPDLVPAGQVDLGDVAGDHDLGAEAEPGQEHLHLLGRGVLRLVEDDERVVERAAAHVRQRRDLDGARPPSACGIDSGSIMSCSASYSGRR